MYNPSIVSKTVTFYEVTDANGEVEVLTYKPTTSNWDKGVPIVKIKVYKERLSIPTDKFIKIAKNKVAPPFKTAVFDLMYGEGISKEASLVNVGTELEIFEKSGSWYSYKGERIAQGKENVKQFLRDNPDIADEIYTTILNKFSVPGQSDDALNVSDDGEIIENGVFIE